MPVSQEVVARVREAIELYAEGGTIRKARQDKRVSAQQFYDVLEQHPDIVQRYRFIQKSRADMFVDEVLELAEKGPVDGTDPRHMRVAADVKLKLAGFYDRPRFGEKIGVEHEVGPNLAEAIAAARQRIALPPRDLGEVTDAEFRALPTPQGERTTDKQSGEQVSKGAGSADPKGIFDE